MLNVCDQCATGYFSNGLGTACIASSVTGCATGYFDDGSGLKCINKLSNCKTGYFDDGSGKKCVNSVSSCAPGYFNDGSGQKCIFNTAICITGYVGNGDGSACIAKSASSTCAANFAYSPFSSNCIWTNPCSGSTLYSNSDGSCSAGACGTGFKNDGALTYRCVT